MCQPSTAMCIHQALDPCGFLFQGRLRNFLLHTINNSRHEFGHNSSNKLFAHDLPQGIHQAMQKLHQQGHSWNRFVVQRTANKRKQQSLTQQCWFWKHPRVAPDSKHAKSTVWTKNRVHVHGLGRVALVLTIFVHRPRQHFPRGADTGTKRRIKLPNLATCG